MATQIFVNLPVKDVSKTVEFFTKLGFVFNPRFTDEKAACMVIGENIYAMLLTESFFKTFTKKEITDTSKATEMLLCISVENREKVDRMISNAIAAGATTPNQKQDDGYMYSHAFEDLDGHIWEIMWMDINQFPKK